jgi:hypothetical protein
VTNRSASRVGYSVPEIGVKNREFAPGETKKVRREELEELSYQPGGIVLIRDYLLVQDPDVRADLVGEVEPEYNMTAAQVQELILTGSHDEWLDCLDFAPEGVIELIKKFSMEVPLTDYDKRQSLKAKTGFDVDAAIANAGKEADAEIEEQRIKEAAAPAAGRRTNTNYKIVNQG